VIAAAAAAIVWVVGEDGYSSDTVPMTTENLTRLQLSLDTGSVGEGSVTPLSISELLSVLYQSSPLSTSTVIDS
jgi:hypothetical protein